MALGDPQGTPLLAQSLHSARGGGGTHPLSCPAASCLARPPALITGLASSRVFFRKVSFGDHTGSTRKESKAHLIYGQGWCHTA